MARATDLASGGLTLVSTSAAGMKGNGDSFAPSLSADGHRVAFLSAATNLTADGATGTQVYVKDLASGAVTLASKTGGGAPGNGEASSPSLSGDGTEVAFASAATNLGDPQPGGVFVADLGSGALTLAAADASGTPANAAAANPRLSLDGSAVAFDTAASNLDPADGNGVRDVYVKQLAGGAVWLASVTAGGVLGNGDSTNPSISGNGGRVAFVTRSTNWSPDAVDPDPEFGQTVFVKDFGGGGLTLESYYNTTEPALSADGSTLAYTTPIPRTASDLDDNEDTYLRNLTTGAVTLASPRGGALTDLDSVFTPSLSSDGHVVAFMAQSSDPEPGDISSYRQDIFVNPAPGSAALGTAPARPAARKAQLSTDPTIDNSEYVTLLIGRTEYAVAPGCNGPAGYAVTLDQVANYYNNQTNPPVIGVGNVVTDDATPPAGGGRQCFGGILYANWNDIAGYHPAPYNWRFISASINHTPFPQLDYSSAQHQSCGSLPIFNNHNLMPEAEGLFAYPDDKNMYTGADNNLHPAQPAIVEHCFSYGRKYGSQPNDITGSTGTPNPLDAPWFATTYSINGGDQTSYTAPRVMTEMLGRLSQRQWLILQPYRFVTGGGPNQDHDCQPGDQHFTNLDEEYCWNDWQQVVNAIPSGATVTDPYTVARNWPGNRDNPS